MQQMTRKKTNTHKNKADGYFGKFVIQRVHLHTYYKNRSNHAIQNEQQQMRKKNYEMVRNDI